MKINGVDISVYGAKQQNVIDKGVNMKNNSDWTAGAITPYMLDTTYGFRSYQVKLIVYGNNRDEIWSKINTILAALKKPSDITLDGFQHTFRMILTGSQHNETFIGRWHTLTLDFKGYQYGDEIGEEYTNSFKTDTPVAGASSTQEFFIGKNLPATTTVEITISIDKNFAGSIGIHGLTFNKYGIGVRHILANVSGMPDYNLLKLKIDKGTGAVFESFNGGTFQLATVIDVEIPTIPLIPKDGRMVTVSHNSNRRGTEEVGKLYQSVVNFKYNPVFL